MRLDKFLQTSRIVKRRAVASELCDKGRVTVNGRPAKAGKDLRVGDVVGLRLRSGSSMACEIRELPRGGVRKDDASKLYAIVEDSRGDDERDG